LRHNQLRNYLALDSIYWWSMPIPCSSAFFPPIGKQGITIWRYTWGHCNLFISYCYMKSILPPSFNSFLYTNRAQVDKTKYDKNLDLTCSIPRSTFLWNKSKIASVSTANKGSKNIIFERRLTLLFRKPWSWYKTGDSSLQKNGTQTN